ncbi:aminopeptidase P family protein [Candidatus Daviesbacteria bacterium]|nr:aminopeptidase P family protein [Candidatus Daviesbacteria bacterium]
MFTSRINIIRAYLNKQKLDAVLISSVFNITYLTGFSNFSKEEREAYLLIGKDFQYIITDARYSEAVKSEVPHLILFERGYKQSTEDLLKKHKKEIKNLGIEEDDLTVAEHKLLKKHFKTIKHLDIKTHRAIKTLEEIDKIKKAAKLGDKAFEYILEKIKPGVSEKEIAFELESFVKKYGADLSFPSIVAFGKNSAVPHHQTGNTKLTGKGEFVLLDFGVKYKNYCSDMTRTVFLGKPSEKQQKIYQAVLAAQQKAIDFINKKLKAGKEIKAGEADKAARDYIVSKGYPGIPHSLGHGIGLEVHEHPFLSSKSKEVLKEGMVFSIEPGIYIPDFGPPRPSLARLREARFAGEAGGVRIEDLFVLEKDKLSNITHSPKQIISI